MTTHEMTHTITPKEIADLRAQLATLTEYKTKLYHDYVVKSNQLEAAVASRDKWKALATEMYERTDARAYLEAYDELIEEEK